MSAGNSPKILVVDDNRTNRLVLEKRLEAEGYEIASAEDGQIALEMVLGKNGDGAHNEIIMTAATKITSMVCLEWFRWRRETVNGIELKN